MSIEEMSMKQKMRNKIEDFSRGIKEKKDNAVEWVKAHPTEAVSGLIALSTIIGGATKLAGKATKAYEIKKEDQRRKLERYDPVTHSWCRLKKPLNAREEVEFAERRQNGESAKIILYSMGKLK